MQTKNYKHSAFKKAMRVRLKQREYIRSIKGKYTLAGKLDEIINYYKRKHDNGLQ